MARPGQLSIALADIFELEPTTVRHHARMLRDAGYMGMENAGRGPGTMTPRDATNLLISVAGASRVKYALRPVENHASCRSRKGAWRLPIEGLPELIALRSDHTLAEAIEALILAAIAGSVDIETGRLGLLTENDPGKLRIDVELREPSVRSKMTIGFYGQDEYGGTTITNKTDRIYDVQVSSRGVFVPPFRASPISDLSHTHSFTEKAIYRLAQEFI